MLVRKEKAIFYSNLDPKLIIDNKNFWKTVKPLFSGKHFISKKLTSLESDKVITADADMSETVNSFSLNDIQGFATNDFLHDPEKTPVDNIIGTFRNHPSIIKKVMPKGSVFYSFKRNRHLR